MKPVLIHTHFHKRKTGLTRSIENVLPYVSKHLETYVYGSHITGNHLSKSTLKSFLFSNRKVLVHCHRNNEILRMLWYRFLGAKFTLIATRHAASKPSKLTKFLLQKASIVITLIKSMSLQLGIQNVLVAHGVTVEKFKPKPGVKLNEIRQENIILNTGRIRKAKGQQVLLEAANVLKDHQNWALVFVGKVDETTFLSDLKSLATKHQIENQVYFVAETTEIIRYYQAAKIFVAPSFSEGFSLVTAEAMACECTVIATQNVGVHSEMIYHQKNGYLFEAGNTKALESILSQLILDKIPYLGSLARAEILRNWSAQKEAANLIKVYESAF